MKKAIIIIILLVFIVLGIMVIYGYFTPYNYLSAKKDIKEKKLTLILVNCHPVRYGIEKRIAKKYGLDVLNISNKYRLKPIYYLGIKSYNNQVEKAFVKINGDSIFKKYKNECDSVENHIIVK